jgi:competence protein ComGC
LKTQQAILIFEITLCTVVKVGMYLISHFIYADVFRVSFAAYLLTSWIVITIIDWKKEINTTRPRVRWFTLLVVAIATVIFVVSKPNFSYTKGKDIVASHGYNNLYELQDKSITSFRLKHTKLVPEAYLYAGEKNNVRYYILLSPIDGEIETEKIGDGNYLDKYFQMKYGR